MREIRSNAELESIHQAGTGLIFNDFTSGPAAADNNRLHAASCPWVERMLAHSDPGAAPTVRKIFFDSLDEALPWLSNHRGQDGVGWKLCHRCGREAAPALAGEKQSSAAKRPPGDDKQKTNKQKTKWSRFLDLGPVWISAIGTLLAAVFAGLGLLITSSAGAGPASSTPSPANETVLPPANVPPHVALCSQQLQIGADGNAGPLSCANGDLNSLAWAYFAKLNLNVMALGADVIPDQVLRAMCDDVRSGGSTPVTELSAYQISSLYYGWHFGVDPGQEFSLGNC